MAKVLEPRLRKAENADWIALGRVIERTRILSGLNLREFAIALGRDERQIARWILGSEQGQAAAILAVKRLRACFVIAMAEQSGEGVEIETTIRLKVRA